MDRSHIKNLSLIYRNDFLTTLYTSTQETQDIVQGLPKIIGLFEARKPQKEKTSIIAVAPGVHLSPLGSNRPLHIIFEKEVIICAHSPRYNVNRQFLHVEDNLTCMEMFEQIMLKHVRNKEVLNAAIERYLEAFNCIPSFYTFKNNKKKFVNTYQDFYLITNKKWGSENFVTIDTIYNRYYDSFKNFFALDTPIESRILFTKNNESFVTNILIQISRLRHPEYFIKKFNTVLFLLFKKKFFVLFGHHLSSIPYKKLSIAEEYSISSFPNKKLNMAFKYLGYLYLIEKYTHIFKMGDALPLKDFLTTKAKNFLKREKELAYLLMDRNSEPAIIGKVVKLLDQRLRTYKEDHRKQMTKMGKEKQKLDYLENNGKKKQTLKEKKETLKRNQYEKTKRFFKEENKNKKNFIKNYYCHLFKVFVQLFIKYDYKRRCQMKAKSNWLIKIRANENNFDRQATNLLKKRLSSKKDYEMQKRCAKKNKELSPRIKKTTKLTQTFYNYENSIFYKDRIWTVFELPEDLEEWWTREGKVRLGCQIKTREKRHDTREFCNYIFLRIKCPRINDLTDEILPYTQSKVTWDPLYGEFIPYFLFKNSFYQFLNKKNSFPSESNFLYKENANNLIVEMVDGRYFYLKKNYFIKQYATVNKKTQVTLRIPELKPSRYIDIGEPLSLGFINPHDLLQAFFEHHSIFDGKLIGLLKCLIKFQLIIVNSIQAIYQSQGVEILSKHIEIIIRQLTSRVLVGHPGKTPFYATEMIRLAFIIEILKMEINKINSFTKTLTNLFDFQPIYSSSINTSLDQKANFLAAAGFQRTKEVLTRAAIEGKCDLLMGLKVQLITGFIENAGSSYGGYKSKLNHIYFLKKF